jgi:predicted short-subunit dehydrogenase-like oxidoreductase (DUF2520 family)
MTKTAGLDTAGPMGAHDSREQMKPLGRLGLIGAGRLGQTLVRACAAAGLPFCAVHSRRADPLQALQQDLGVKPALSAQAVVDGCDTVFITVADDAIQSVCDSLEWRAGQAVVHCSGATELAALRAAAQQGAVIAGFHPLHTFGDVHTALSGLPGCAVAVEASDPHTLQALTALAQALGTRPFELPAGSRALYHASAHYAGSLVVTLMDEAVRHWARMGVGQEQALVALLPLLRSTVRAMEARGLGPGMAGVVARGDAGVLQQHLQALDAVGPDERQLYAEISRRSVRLALEAGRISAEQAQAMIPLLDP